MTTSATFLLLTLSFFRGGVSSGISITDHSSRRCAYVMAGCDGDGDGDGDGDVRCTGFAKTRRSAGWMSSGTAFGGTQREGPATAFGSIMASAMGGCACGSVVARSAEPSDGN